VGIYYLECYGEGEKNIFSVSLQQKQYIRNRLLGMADPETLEAA
jgi:hypothetical protein